MTTTQQLLAQFDAAELGPCALTLWEHERPGAIAALRSWAECRDRIVVEHDHVRVANCLSFSVGNIMVYCRPEVV